ncbi:hypothetical protein KHA80_22430 [Anaerobacillus sp. HL2]|nr:hypothetical protein KHA80_22430 [Anaerobacillus sp. HL2]
MLVFIFDYPNPFITFFLFAVMLSFSIHNVFKAIKAGALQLL